MPEARLTLRVQPGARRSGVVGLVEGVLRVRVAAPMREGKANAALVELLATLLGVPKTSIRILRGLSARSKVVVAQGLSQEDAMRRLGAA